MWSAAASVFGRTLAGISKKQSGSAARLLSSSVPSTSTSLSSEKNSNDDKNLNAARKNASVIAAIDQATKQKDLKALTRLLEEVHASSKPQIADIPPLLPASSSASSSSSDLPSIFLDRLTLSDAVGMLVQSNSLDISLPSSSSSSASLSPSSELAPLPSSPSLFSILSYASSTLGPTYGQDLVAQTLDDCLRANLPQQCLALANNLSTLNLLPPRRRMEALSVRCMEQIKSEFSTLGNLMPRTPLPSPESVEQPIVKKPFLGEVMGVPGIPDTITDSSSLSSLEKPDWVNDAYVDEAYKEFQQNIKRRARASKPKRRPGLNTHRRKSSDAVEIDFDIGVEEHGSQKKKNGGKDKKDSNVGVEISEFNGSDPNGSGKSLVDSLRAQFGKSEQKYVEDESGNEMMAQEKELESFFGNSIPAQDSRSRLLAFCDSLAILSSETKYFTIPIDLAIGTKEEAYILQQVVQRLRDGVSQRQTERRDKLKQQKKQQKKDKREKIAKNATVDSSPAASSLAYN